MKKEIWSGYLRKTAKTAAFFVLCMAVPPVIGFLYGLPREPFLYSLALCACVGAGAFFYGYFRYKKRYLLLEGIRGNLPEGLEKLPGDADGLEALYGEILKALNWQRMDAERQKNSLYEEFTDYYTMWAHQIKTPISALRLLLQEEAAQNRDALNELFKIEEYVEMVLIYLRTEDMSSDMRFQSYALDGIIREQLHRFARIFIGKKISLDYEGVDETVLTDEKWLGFVIGQVLSNALKYTKKGKISIYMKDCMETDCMEAEKTLVIEDTGMGISSQDMPRVFEKGFTGCNGRTDRHSTGIGLYLCAKIMKRLGHTISIESEQGKGTKVYLKLGREELEIL